MSYTLDDYLEEEQERLNKLFPPINYKKMYEKARKSHICEYCGCEIPIGDQVWWYKANPTWDRLLHKQVYYKWKTRCIDHEPNSHAELEEIKAKEAK